jgi:hypothetical protein
MASLTFSVQRFPDLDEALGTFGFACALLFSHVLSWFSYHGLHAIEYRRNQKEESSSVYFISDQPDKESVHVMWTKRNVIRIAGSPLHFTTNQGTWLPSSNYVNQLYVLVLTQEVPELLLDHQNPYNPKFTDAVNRFAMDTNGGCYGKIFQKMLGRLIQSRPNPRAYPEGFLSCFFCGMGSQNCDLWHHHNKANAPIAHCRKCVIPHRDMKFKNYKCDYCVGYKADASHFWGVGDASYAFSCEVCAVQPIILVDG